MGEPELNVAHLDMARSWLMRNGSVLLYGESAGPDTAVAIDSLIRAANGRRVLSCRGPVGQDRPLGALSVLLSSVDRDDVAALPPTHRRILTETIFHPAPVAGPAARPVPPVAQLGPVVLDLLRTLSRTTPVLLVLDAVHRLDPDTRAVLWFVAQQADELPVHVVAVEKVGDASTPKGYRICPAPLVMIRFANGRADARISPGPVT